MEPRGSVNALSVNGGGKAERPGGTTMKRWSGEVATANQRRKESQVQILSLPMFALLKFPRWATVDKI